jgi:hypothetical protein
MQIRSFRGSGEPARVNALPSARFCLGPDPRRALGPAVNRAASTGRTRDRTRPMLQLRQKVLARAPSTRDPTTSPCWWRWPRCGSADELKRKPCVRPSMPSSAASWPRPSTRATLPHAPPAQRIASAGLSQGSVAVQASCDLCRPSQLFGLKPGQGRDHRLLNAAVDVEDLGSQRWSFRKSHRERSMRCMMARGRNRHAKSMI